MEENPYDMEANIYDEINKFRKHEEHVAFMLDEFYEHNGKLPKTVLDVGCGTGNHILEFARKKIESWGVDSSKNMLNIAINKIKVENVSVNLVNSDILSYHTNTKFDLIYSLYGVVNLFSKSDLKMLFAWFKEHLKANGILFFDFYTTVGISYPPTSWLRVQKDNSEIIRLQFNKNNHKDKTTIAMRTYLQIEGSSVLRRSAQDVFFQLYTKNWLLGELSKVGFRNTRCYNADVFSYNKKPFTRKSYLGLIITR